VVAQDRKSFERLSDVLEQIEDSQISQAIQLVRECRAGKSMAARQEPLAETLEGLERHELMWLEMVLCVRVQQLGRDSAWRRFAESSYRELVPFYR
jgi:hypothetical protein